MLDHFLEKAIEAEADAICDGEDVVHYWNYGTY
jgi:hypothetical protein